MKTDTDIKQEIAALEKEFFPMAKGARLRKKAEKRVLFLRKCAAYLESGPKEEFIQKSIGDLRLRLISISEQYKVWKEAGNGAGKANPYTVYKREMGVKKIKDQIATLNFLLK